MKIQCTDQWDQLHRAELFKLKSKQRICDIFSKWANPKLLWSRKDVHCSRIIIRIPCNFQKIELWTRLETVWKLSPFPDSLFRRYPSRDEFWYHPKDPWYNYQMLPVQCLSKFTWVLLQDLGYNLIDTILWMLTICVWSSDQQLHEDDDLSITEGYSITIAERSLTDPSRVTQNGG